MKVDHLKRHGGVRGKCMSAQQAEKHGRSLLKPILGDLSPHLFKEAVSLYAAAYSGRRWPAACRRV